MRQDAIRRVQEMQRRARMSINNTNRAMSQVASERSEAPVLAQAIEVKPEVTELSQAVNQQRERAVNPIVVQEAPPSIEVAQPMDYQTDQVYDTPVAPSYIENDTIIEPVEGGFYSQTNNNDSFSYGNQQEAYPPPDMSGPMQGYGGPVNIQQDMSGRNMRSNQSTAMGGSQNTLSNLLGSLFGSGNKGSGQSGETLMDTVAGLKSNLGETLSNTLSSVTSPVTDIMDAFGIDGDKLIIIALILILLNEKSDKTLLLALGYLLIF